MRAFRYNYDSALLTSGFSLSLRSLRFPNGLILTNGLDTNSFQVTNRLWYTNAIGETPLATNRLTYTGKGVPASRNADWAIALSRRGGLTSKG